MEASITYHDQVYSFNPLQPHDISMPLHDRQLQPECFWAEPVQFDVIRVGDFVGSVSEGGSTNYKRVHLTPHGNGTHTECYGHISADEHATIHNCLKRFLFVAQLITIAPQKLENGDEVVLLDDVKKQLEGLKPEAVILRTLPNTDDKLTRHYSGSNPPYLEHIIGQYLAEKGVQHLLLDLPSVDRELDEGKLLCHHAFWQYPKYTRCGATITELIYVPEHVTDGLYLLNLQIASLQLDASPSKPVLYSLSPAFPQL
ncbi:cyclase family protein [Pontibacter sp. BT310]|uniref:Cyclase family protein n=1 Tax=Pontibacter populi TaxID=890055 RepID=A0ABS6X9K8_9BACT|nr:MULTISPECIES: cyclase family protein [Pontibacter]MBJ6117719.1 cyclase family protein [Pontibacter sp. BT310]MBR0570145.1 cyclase family protein [Microvirga sp. STS03]MBW3364571.1 cyclase family protein [Pontibacter populi]